MTKRIKLSAGDYVLLSDIPNEQVFNLVKKCFINAGFQTEEDWDGVCYWDVWHVYTDSRCCFAGIHDHRNKRQLSLSDIFNSLNGGFDWYNSDLIHLLKNGLIFYSGYGVLEILLQDFDVEGYKSITTIKRITDSPEAINQPEAPQWWDYGKGCAVGLPEKNTVVLYNGKEYEVIRSAVNDTNDNVVLLCLNTNRPNTKSDVFWENIANIKPLDWDKLSKRKEVVQMALEYGEHADTFKSYTERLYDVGMLKVAE